MSTAPAEYSTKQLLTADDLAQMPEDGTRHELVRGALIEMPRPKYRHGRVQGRISVVIGNYVYTHQLGDTLLESGFRLASGPDTVRGPDFAFVAHARALPYAEQDQYFDGAPDLAVEIVSPNDTAAEVRELVDQYLAAGALLVWVVYAMFRTVEVHRPNGTVTVLRATDDLDGEGVLPGFRAPVSSLFD